MHYCTLQRRGPHLQETAHQPCDKPAGIHIIHIIHIIHSGRYSCTLCATLAAGREGGVTTAAGQLPAGKGAQQSAGSYLRQLHRSSLGQLLLTLTRPFCSSPLLLPSQQGPLGSRRGCPPSPPSHSALARFFVGLFEGWCVQQGHRA